MRKWLVLVITFLVFSLVAAVSLAMLLTAVRITVQEAESKGEVLAQQMFYFSKRVLDSSREQGIVRALRTSPVLRSLLESSVGYSETTLYIMLTDLQEVALIHSERGKEGQKFSPRPALSQLAKAGPLRQLLALYRGPRIYEVNLALRRGGQAFGQVRVGISINLLRHKLSFAIGLGLAVITVSCLLAGLVSIKLANFALLPLRRISEGLERWGQGDFSRPIEVGKQEELEALSSKFKSVEQFIIETQSRLHEGGNRLENIINQLEEGIVLLNRDKRIVLFNPVMERFFGRSLSQGVGSRLLDLGMGLAPLDALVEKAFLSACSLKAARVTLPVDGAERMFLVYLNVIQDASGVVGGLIELKDLNSLLDLKERVDYSGKLAALSRVSAGIAHEIKNPLNSMVIHLELLRCRLVGTGEDKNEHLKVIGEEIKRLDKVVKGFLDFTRPLEFNLQLLKINDLITEVAQFLASDAEACGVKFDLDLMEINPSVMVDATLLKQALINLLLNAKESMPQGGKVTIHTSKGADGSTQISIQDEGVGIAPENAPRVFDLFYTTKEGGNGIGLSIVYRVIQLHNGEVFLDSQLGRGTTVTIKLPSLCTG